MFHVKPNYLVLISAVLWLIAGCGAEANSSHGSSDPEPLSSGSGGDFWGTGGTFAGTGGTSATATLSAATGGKFASGGSSELTGGNVSTGGARATGGASMSTGGSPLHCVLLKSLKTSSSDTVRCSCLCSDVDYRTEPCSSSDLQCMDGNCATCFQSTCTAGTRDSLGDCVDITDAHYKWVGYVNQDECALALYRMKTTAGSGFEDCP